MNKKQKTRKPFTVITPAAARRNNIYIGNPFAWGGEAGMMPENYTDEAATAQQQQGEQAQSRQGGSNIAGKIGGIAGAAMSSIDLYTKNLTADKIDTTANTGWSKESLLGWSQQLKGANNMNNVFQSGMQDTMTGASAGTSVSPGFGTLIGAGVGLINGVGTALVGNSIKRKRNKEINQNMADKVRGMNDAINMDASANWLANSAALGGRLLAYGGNFSTGATPITAGG
jgi:hypothetical protein